ncbi:hypothetical protein EB796_001061 [Bugula neritina]|uniref:Uncharacterized protein n=1 Tax=Bugula neritina TaxID=10212 RepID=A0A7J7KR76_BUGNE|nr:hypothetical protein EB796_001061 [Bugula neritina]
MQWSNNRLYAMEELGDTGAKVHIYDEHFSQWGSWLVRKKVCDLAVNNEQVYLCTATCNILVFSTDGHFQYEIEGDLGQRITHHSKADMLVITNHSSDTVSFLNGRTKEVEWTIEVEKPWGAYVDEYEAIWVWSEFNQEFEIYDSKGEFVQSAGHPRMIGIGEINTCCVHSGYLWMGYDGGIYRFAVGFR